MTKDNKSVAIKQRIPIDALHNAFSLYIRGYYDRQIVKEQLAITYQGQTALKEVESQINSIVTNSPMDSFIKEHTSEILAALNSGSDREVVLVALIAARYPFCYQLLCAFASQFRLQDEVNTALMKRIIGNTYGLNVKIDKAFHSVLSSMVEANMITKIKDGLYGVSPTHKASYDITNEMWRESFYVNNPLWNRENTEDLIFEPYFRFIDNLVVNV